MWLFKLMVWQQYRCHQKVNIAAWSGFMKNCTKMIDILDRKLYYKAQKRVPSGYVEHIYRLKHWSCSAKLMFWRAIGVNMPVWAEAWKYSCFCKLKCTKHIYAFLILCITPVRYLFTICSREKELLMTLIFPILAFAPNHQTINFVNVFILRRYRTVMNVNLKMEI